MVKRKMSNNQDQQAAKRTNEASSSTARHFGGFLGGTGDGRLTKHLHLTSASIQAATTKKQNTNALLDRLKSFLPQMAKANEILSVEGSASAEGVEILAFGEGSEEEEESSEDEDNGDGSPAQSAKVEMDISLFPIEDSNDDDNAANINGTNANNLHVKRVKKSKIEEID